MYVLKMLSYVFIQLMVAIHNKSLLYLTYIYILYLISTPQSHPYIFMSIHWRLVPRCRRDCQEKAHHIMQSAEALMNYTKNNYPRRVVYKHALAIEVYKCWLSTEESHDTIVLGNLLCFVYLSCFMLGTGKSSLLHYQTALWW